MLEKLGNANNVKAYWNAAAPHMQAHYCHNTLGTKIKVERIGNFEYFNQAIVASSVSLETVKSNARQVIGSADLVVYMAHDPSSLYGTIGITWVPVICSGSLYEQIFHIPCHPHGVRNSYLCDHRCP